VDKNLMVVKILSVFKIVFASIIL